MYNKTTLELQHVKSSKEMCLKPLMLPVKFPCILAISSRKVFADYIHTSSAHTWQLEAGDLKSKHRIIWVMCDRGAYSKLPDRNVRIIILPPIKASRRCRYQYLFGRLESAVCLIGALLNNMELLFQHAKVCRWGKLDRESFNNAAK